MRSSKRDAAGVFGRSQELFEQVVAGWRTPANAASSTTYGSRTITHWHDQVTPEEPHPIDITLGGGDGPADRGLVHVGQPGQQRVRRPPNGWLADVARPPRHGPDGVRDRRVALPLQQGQPPKRREQP